MKCKLVYLVVLGGVLSIFLVGTTKAQNKKSTTKNDTSKPSNNLMIQTQADKFSYAVGLNIGQSIISQGLGDSLNLALMTKALEDIIKKSQTLISIEESQTVIQEYMMAQQSKIGDKNLALGRAFLADNAKKPGVVTLPSGLQYQILKEGNGPKPKETDRVTTHYHGTLINGEVFDSSVERGQPATFPVNGVIRGWVEALQLMKVGSKWRLFIPSELAYGPNGAGPKIGPNTTLIFEVELLKIEE